MWPSAYCSKPVLLFQHLQHAAACISKNCINVHACASFKRGPVGEVFLGLLIRMPLMLSIPVFIAVVTGSLASGQPEAQLGFLC